MYVFWKMKWDKHINKLAKVKDFLIIFQISKIIKK